MTLSAMINCGKLDAFHQSSSHFKMLSASLRRTSTTCRSFGQLTMSRRRFVACMTVEDEPANDFEELVHPYQDCLGKWPKTYQMHDPFSYHTRITRSTNATDRVFFRHFCT